MKIAQINKIDNLNMFERVLLKDISDNKKINITIAVDTSGSMVESSTRKVLNSIKTILTDKDFVLNIWCFDTRVQLSTVKTITSENLSILDGYEFSGFGGSLLDESLHYANTNHPDSDLNIIITDGMLEPYCGVELINNVVYLITDSENNYFYSDKARCFSLFF
jgi:predicted metal-dependent peptidase